MDEDLRLAEAHARIAALPKYQRHEAARRLSRSYSVPDSCIRDDECRREGDEIVWPDGERWPTRPVAYFEARAAAIREWLQTVPISKVPMSDEEKASFTRLQEHAATAEYPPKTPACIRLLFFLRELPISDEQRERLWDLHGEAVKDAERRAPTATAAPRAD